jgi:hypothetical protein
MRALVLAVVCAAGPSATAAEKTPVAVGDWSEPADGLRGRLLVYQGRTLGDGKTRETLVYVELQNVAESGERNVYFDPDGLKCDLLDVAGKAAPRPAEGGGGSGGRPGKTWVRLPHDSTLRLRASPYGYGSPAAVGLLLPIGTDTWLIKAGDTADYFLAGTFASRSKDGAGINVWAGELILPKANVVRPAAPSPVPPVGKRDDSNPVFGGWKGFKPGTAVTVRQAQTSNGALTEALVTYTLVEAGPDGLVLEGRYSDVQRKKTDDRPARVEVPQTIRLTADDRNELAVPLEPEGVYEEGTETVTVSGTACKARWYKYRGSDTNGTWEGRKWVSADVPGRLLKSELTVNRAMMTTVSTIEVVEVKKH